MTFRFAKTNCLEDLDKIIEIGHQVVANTPTTKDPHVGKTLWLVTLGPQLTMRSIHNQPDDLGEAIDVFEQALGELPNAPKAQLRSLVFRHRPDPYLSIRIEHEESNVNGVKDLDRS